MPTYEDWANNPYQFKMEGEQAVSYSPRYWTDLLGLQELVQSGKASPWDRQNYQMQMDAAQQAPMRDPSTLQYNAGEQDATTLSGGSPDLARIMLSLQDKLRQGTATDQERELYATTHRGLADQTYRSVVPQASDAFNPLGDQFFGALGMLGLGATGGLAGGALAAGGGLASTLGSLGTLAGIGGTAASALGGEMDQEWLQKLGLGLGAVGGIAGGVGGLANLWGTGINSLSDAAQLAGNAGRVVGGIGTVADSDVLKQAGTYLSAAGQGGAGVDTLSNIFSGGVNNLTDLARLANAAGQVTGAAGRVTGNRPLQQASSLLNIGGNVRGLLSAGQQAQDRGRQTQAQAPRTTNDGDWLSQNWQPGPWQPSQSVLWNL